MPGDDATGLFIDRDRLDIANPRKILMDQPDVVRFLGFRGARSDAPRDMYNPLDSVERAVQVAQELKDGDAAVDIGNDAADSDSVLSPIEVQALLASARPGGPWSDFDSCTFGCGPETLEAAMPAIGRGPGVLDVRR